VRTWYDIRLGRVNCAAVATAPKLVLLPTARGVPPMLMLAKRFSALFLVLLISGAALADGPVRPIRALLVTGGGWHDFETQKKIIT
jgi:hypothetical protein